MVQGAGEGDGGAVDGADGGGPGAVEEGPGAVVAADLVEPVGAEQDEREGGAEGDGRGEDAADQAGGGVADDGDGLDDRAGGDLAQGDGVEELGAGHPVVVADRVGLHERDDDEPAAVGQGPDLERHPGHRQQHPAADRPGRQYRGHRYAGQFGAVATAGGELHGEFDQPAAQQHQHQPGTKGGGGGRPGDQVTQPARRLPAALPARAGQTGARVDGHRRDRSTSTGARAQYPQRRRGAKEQDRQRQDNDQSGDDERGTPDQRPRPAAQPPGAEDRELGGCRAGQQVAGRDRVLELLGVQPFAALHAQVAQQPDVRRRAAEPDAADPPPLPQDRSQGHPRRFGGGRLPRAGRARAGAAHYAARPGRPMPASR